MTLGPLEYVMVAFEGNRFSGQILSELRAAQEKGIIRVIDLLVIKKDEQGGVMARELSDLSEEEARPFGFLAGDLLSIFEPDDVEATASQMSNNSAAGLLLLEHSWAVPLKQAILNAGAYAAGHHMATKSANQQYTDAQQNAQIDDLQQQQEQPAYQQPVSQQPPSPPMYQQPAYPPPQAPAPAPSGGITPDGIAQLKQLGQLHESGILTDAEFETAKQKILGNP